MPRRPKWGGSGEEVAVVGVDFVVAMVGGTGEAEGIGRAEEGGRGSSTVSFLNWGLHFRRERMPDKARPGAR